MAKKSETGLALAASQQARRRRPRQVNLEYVESLKSYAELLMRGGLAPSKGVCRAETIAAIIEVGRDVGLPATQAIANIAIVNGRPSIYGDAGMALIRASGLLEDIEETYEGVFPDDNFMAVCRIKRVGSKRDRVARFSIADAKAAHLWEKKGPWCEYPRRQMMWRAKGFCTRDEFQDVLLGLIFVEEANDIEGSGPEKGQGSPAGSIPPLLGASKPVTPAQLERIGELYDLVCASAGVSTDDDCQRVWSETLAEYRVSSAREFSEEQAAAFIAATEKKQDPFSQSANG